MTSRKFTMFALAGVVLLTLIALIPTPAAAFSDSGSQTIQPDHWYYWDDFVYSTSWTLSVSVSVGYSDPNFDVFLVTSAEYSNYENGYSFDDISACSHENLRSLSSSTCTAAAGSYVLIFDNTNAGTAQTNGYSDTFTYAISGTAISGGSMSVTAYSNKQSGSSPLLVTFSATASGGTSPYSYTWDFGDSSTGTGASTTHSYSSTGTYYASVMVKDYNLQTVTSTEITITVSNSSVDTSGATMILMLMCVLPIVIIIVVVILVLYFVMRRRSAPAYQPPMGQPYMAQQPQQPYYSPPPPPPMDPYQQSPPPYGGGGGNYQQPPPPPPYGSGSTYQSPPPPPYR